MEKNYHKLESTRAIAKHLVLVLLRKNSAQMTHGLSRENHECMCFHE